MCCRTRQANPLLQVVCQLKGLLSAGKLLEAMDLLASSYNTCFASKLSGGVTAMDKLDLDTFYWQTQDVSIDSGTSASDARDASMFGRIFLAAQRGQYSPFCRRDYRCIESRRSDFIKEFKKFVSSEFFMHQLMNPEFVGKNESRGVLTYKGSSEGSKFKSPIVMSNYQPYMGAGPAVPNGFLQALALNSGR